MKQICGCNDALAYGYRRTPLTNMGRGPYCNLWMPTIVEGDVEWDERKALANLAKHGISFAEAATVFADPHAVYLDDGSGTNRMVVIGASLRARVLYVVHVERGPRDRIISARRATQAEREGYLAGDTL